MQTRKSNYFNAYKFTRKLLPLLICGFLFACSRQNETKQVLPIENQLSAAVPVVNINTASASELEKLPRIGEKTARDIIEYREKFGRFRQPQHLLLVHGISDKKYREIKSLIAVE